MRGALLGSATLFAVLFTRDARADVPAQLGDAMHTYFDGERSSGYLWGTVGILSASSGGFLLTRKTPITRGAAYPLIAIGAIQTIIGGVLLFGTNARVEKLDAKLAENPRVFRDDELARIRGVNRTFVILEIVEAVMIAGGTTLAIAGRDTWRGVGIGLAISGTTMLAIDALAHARGTRYERALEGINIAATAQTVTIGGVF